MEILSRRISLETIGNDTPLQEDVPGGHPFCRSGVPDDEGVASQVKVIIRFVVGKDGTLSAYAVDQSGGPLFDAEVIRVLKKMPKWTPGLQNGRPVAVYFNLPATFVRPGD